jgi:hypothetical protein
MIARPAGLKSIGFDFQRPFIALTSCILVPWAFPTRHIVHNSDAIGVRVTFLRRTAGSDTTALAYSSAIVIFSRLRTTFTCLFYRERARLRCPQRE